MSTLVLLVPLVLLVLRVMLPGILATSIRADLLTRTGRALFIGVVFNLLLAVVALSTGHWYRGIDWWVWGLFVAGGIRIHARHGTLSAILRAGVRPALLVLAAAAFVLLLPVRSEWRMGGWDPGFYQNNAVRIARDGSLDGPRGGLYAMLAETANPDAPADWKALAPLVHLPRAQFGCYVILADSLPLEADGRIPLFFFHLTPIAGAGLHRLGGDAFLDRANGFFAFGDLFVFASLLATLGLRGTRRALPLFFMALSPLWWYQQNVPTSEMLYLFLLLGGTADWIASRDAGRRPWLAWAACFLLVLNHLNAAVLVGVLVAVGSLLETAAAADPLPRRTRLLRAGGAVAAIAAGFAWDLVFARSTIVKLQTENGSVLILEVLAVLVAAACVAMAALNFPRALRRPAALLVRAAALLVALLVPIVALTSLSGAARDWYYWAYANLNPPGPFFQPGQMLWWLMRISPFFGIPALVLGGLGIAWLALGRDPRLRRAAMCALAFGTVFLVVWINPGIRKLFPWALRRFCVFALPTLAIAQAAPVVWALDAFRRKPERTPRARGVASVVLATAAVLVLLTLPVTRAAARAGDYPGLVSVLKTLHSTMRPGDVIVADNSAWMAPLILAGDVSAVNGERLMSGDAASFWREPDPAVRATLHGALRHWALMDGHRLLWLTTTSDGLSVYPEPPAVDPAPLLALDYPATTVAHGQRQKTYETSTRTIPLRLYATLPPPSPEQP